MIDNIINELAKVCISHSSQIVTAESCTGGLIAKLITDLAGSSQWFDRGFVTYTNLAKEQMLGVNQQLLTDYGAVSEAVAEAMAKGALDSSQASFSLSVTGIAGPGGGTETKPVGLVCFAWAYYSFEKNSFEKNSFEKNGTEKNTLENNNVIVISSSQRFSGDRDAIRNQSAFFSLQKMLEIITNKQIG